VLVSERSGDFGSFSNTKLPKNVGKTVARDVVVKAQGSQSSIEMNTHAIG